MRNRHCWLTEDMKKPPIGRTIACVLASVLVLAGAFVLYETHRLRQEFYEGSEIRPLDLAVDFSKPGEFTTGFKQTWRPHHWQPIDLYVPPEVLAEVSPSDLLASLAFKWQITDSKGNIVDEAESSGEMDWHCQTDSNAIRLSSVRPCALGDYTFACTVISGAPALDGVDQRLVCQYKPCGIELLSLFFIEVAAIVAFVIAGVILFVVGKITKRKRQQISQQSPAGDVLKAAPDP